MLTIRISSLTPVRGLTFDVFLSYIIRKLCLLMYHSSRAID
jgi:hypothetical protein